MAMVETTTIEKIGKSRRFFTHIYWGVVDRFPFCCILRFTIEMTRLDGKTIEAKDGMARKRGVLRTRRGQPFVPCNIFHHALREDDNAN